MHILMSTVSYLEVIAKARLETNVTKEFERLKALNQLIRYGICTCQCHFSADAYHSAEPCCGNAKVTPK